MDTTTPLRLLQSCFAHMSCLLDRQRGCLPCRRPLPLLLLLTIYSWQ